MFWIIVVVIIVFYVVFILSAISLIASGKPFTKDFSIAGVVLVGMTGSIPTILAIFLLTGLFSSKESEKDKAEKSSSSDLVASAKLIAEVAKFMSKSH